MIGVKLLSVVVGFAFGGWQRDNSTNRPMLYIGVISSRYEDGKTETRLRSCARHTYSWWEIERHRRNNQ